MTLVFGPALGLRSASRTSWTLSVLIATEPDVSPPALHATTEGQSLNPSGFERILSARGTGKVADAQYDLHVAELEVPRQSGGTTLAYRLGDEETYEVAVPGSGEDAHLRIAYGSCNGFSSRKERRRTDEKYACWADLSGHHGDEQPYHVLILGGDQIYADTLWDDVVWLRHWTDEDENKWKREPDSALKQQLEDFYAELYRRTWSREGFSNALARIPALMMWDDHDIFDGWGSHFAYKGDGAHGCPVYDAIFEVAEKYFHAFQLHRAWRTGDSGFIGSGHASYGVDFGRLSVLALDLRTQRSRERILNRSAWDEIFEWLQSRDGLDHLVVLSSVPVLHLNLETGEDVLNLLPGEQSVEDDLRDHWLSPPHRRERLRLLNRLFDFAADHDTKVTFLSGDVHVGAAGRIERAAKKRPPKEADAIAQLTSSPIVHPIPPSFLAWAFERLSAFQDAPERIDEGITGYLTKFPDSGEHLIRARNWLSLEMAGTDGRLEASWHVEGSADVRKRQVRSPHGSRIS